MGAWPDRAIADLAGRQGTMITRAQLLDLQVARTTVHRAVARGRLHRVHQGVYSLVAAPARPPLAPEWAAHLACGPSAAVSGLSAARVHGLRLPRPPRTELTVVGSSRGRRRAELLVHHAETLHPAELVRIRGLPVTSITRVAIDVESRLSDRALEHLVDQVLRRAGRAALSAVIERHRGRPGIARLRELLDPARPSAETWSIAEERLLALLRRAGLPAPEVNVALGGYVPDLLWRDQRVIVEFDSVAHHSGPGSFHHDRVRHNELVAQGYQVLHVTWRQLTETPEQVLVWIAVALNGG